MAVTDQQTAEGLWPGCIWLPHVLRSMCVGSQLVVPVFFMKQQGT